MPKRKRAAQPERNPEPEPKQEKDQKDKTKKTPAPEGHFEIPVEGKKSIQCERHGNPESKPDLIFTHGAGGGLNAPAMQDFATGFTETGNLVMFKGNMNLKSRVSSFQRVIEHEDCHSALGGRSMGARAACLAAQESESKVDALVLVSFPLIGASKGDSREQTLLDLPESVDVLLISGTEDTMCDLDHLRTVTGMTKARSWIVEAVGADHGMAVKPKAGTEPMRKATGEVASQWLKDRGDASKRSLTLVWDDDEQVVASSGWEEKSAMTDGAEQSPEEEEPERSPEEGEPEQKKLKNGT